MMNDELFLSTFSEIKERYKTLTKSKLYKEMRDDLDRLHIVSMMVDGKRKKFERWQKYDYYYMMTLIKLGKHLDGSVEYDSF